MLSNAANAAGPPRRGAVSRFLLPIVLLIAIIGGIAWVVQYLPSMYRKTKLAPDTRRPLLALMPNSAIWRKDQLEAKKDADAAKSEVDIYKEFEQGTSGHYDFFFKNIYGGDIEIVAYESACDCASVKACVLPADEHERLTKIFADKPGEPLPYAKEPSWHDLVNDTATKKSLVVKEKEAGIIRVGWVARKAPGLPLNVSPKIFVQPAGDSTGRGFYGLNVPVMVRPAVQFNPQRVSVGVFLAGGGAKVLEKEFDAWSATRPTLNLKLATHRGDLKPDPFFDIQTRTLTKEECKELEERLNARKEGETPAPPTRVRSGVRIAVKVYENKDGQQLELGSFYRKLLINLDGVDERDMPGPEIVGRVEGGITVGGTDNFGRINFKIFKRSVGATEVVRVTAPANVDLKFVKCEPSWVEVKLTLDEKENTQKSRTWRLEAAVPPDTPLAQSFDEPSAIELRITGDASPRLIRIPIHGHVEN